MLERLVDYGIFMHHETSEYTCRQFILHQHDDYEFYFFVRGNVRYRYGDREWTLQPNSLVFVYPGTSHGFMTLSDEPYERYVLQIDKNAVKRLQMAELISMVYDKHGRNDTCFELPPGSDIPDKMTLLLNDSIEAEEKRKLFTPLVGGMLLTLLAQPVKNTEDRIARTPSKTKSHVITDVIYWINTHIEEELSIGELSRRFYISRSVLCSRFKEQMGMSIMDYIRNRRLDLVTQLMDEGYSAVSASMIAGFKDYSTFYRAYQLTYGAAPRSRKHKDKSNT